MPSPLRFLETGYTYAELSTSLSPAIEKYLEAERAPCTLVVNFFRENSITIGVFEDPEKSLHLDFCREQGIELRRRQNPGGAVFGTRGSAMACLYLDLEQDWVPFKNIRDAFPYYLERMSAAAEGIFGLEAVYRPVNDIEVMQRKLIATSARLENNILTLRSVINVCPVERSLVSGAIIARPEKFADKKQKDGGSRFTCFQDELGREVDQEEIRRLAIETIRRTFGKGIGIEPGEMTPDERRYFLEYQERYASREWFFANSERVRFADAGPGVEKAESYHKAPAGLMGLALLARDNTVADVILLADFHPSPLSVMARLEDAVRGQPLALDALMNRLAGVYDDPSVEIPGTDLGDFGTLFGKALGQLRPDAS